MKRYIEKEVYCPYCHRPAVLRPASELFSSKELNKKLLYVCAGYPVCDAYVAAHERTLEPMGTLADRALRNKRIQAHRAFDILWQKGPFTRRGAYQLLRLRFGLSDADAHIGKFSSEMCEQTVLFANKLMAGQQTRKSA